MSKQLALGLDLGTNSIGWALIEHDSDGEPCGLAVCGVRIFQDTVEAKTGIPKNQSRRAARAARRLIARRRRRKDKLLNLLVHGGLLPQNMEERQILLTDNKTYEPYQLRKRAIDEKLQPFEFGRAIYHLGQRRGFQSNRKAASKDDGDVKKAISLLSTEMQNAGARTLGEFLSTQPKKRSRYTDRGMYQEEFEKIWQAQQDHHPGILNPAFKVAVHNAIFHQRPLKLQKFLVGKCTFEPSRKRASRAIIEFQRFRILQDVNHLCVKDPLTRDLRKLEPEEQKKLVALLEKQKTLSWNKARKALKLHDGEVFNLEEGKKKELAGDRTTYALRSILDGAWDEMDGDKQNRLVTDMLTIDNEQGFLNRMKAHWGFDEETAEKLAKTELESGYARLSLKAIRKVLPYLEQGMRYDEACKAAGYDHSNPLEAGASESLGEPPMLRNPVVQKAIYETRKVVNAIVRRYGIPATIRIEMARDMKLTRRQKDESHKNQREREKENKATEERLRNELGIQNPARADIQKYQMWKECGMTCPYTGTPISEKMLFSNDVDVEHIIPYSRCLDDSYMNKTLCLAAENRDVKKNNTPFEAYHADAEKYSGILNRVKALPFPKRRRFEQKEVDTDKFVERQLNDTRYICVEVKNYLARLGASVEVTKGEATGALRHRWGLNRILSEDGSGEKNRADHRHHAVDAVVIALTSRSLFRMLSRLSATSGVSLGERGFPLQNPWPTFYPEVCEKIRAVTVSHAARRKLSDALHEKTAYGYLEGKGLFAYRKPLRSLKNKGQIEDIGDPVVRELAGNRLAEFDGDFKKAFGNDARPLLHLDGKTRINSVRLHVKVRFPDKSMFAVKRDGKAYKYFDLGNNHHVEILEDVKTGKRTGVFVTTIEAARRARIDKTPIVQREHGPGLRFVMSLCPGDMLEIVDDEGVVEYYRVQKMSGSNNTIILRRHQVTATSDMDRTGLLQCNPNTMPRHCRKVSIDCLGNAAPCND